MLVTERPVTAGPTPAPPVRQTRRRPAWPDLLLAAALVVGLALRFHGLDWDDRAHLHPDERQIVMVAERLHWPRPGDELTAGERGGHSALDPHFFAYGSLPLYLLASAGHVAHAVGVALDGTPAATSGVVDALVAANGYDTMNLVGRALSALFDAASILLCYLLGRQLWSPREGALAAAFYATATLAVQQAHFYVVDPILTCLVLATLLASLRLARGGRVRDGLIAGVCFGAALATKVSALPLGLALVLAVALPLLPGAGRGTKGRGPRAETRLAGLGVALLAAAATFLLAEPYALLDWPQFRHDILEQSAMARGIADYPYTRQYAPTKPYLYWLLGLVSWQLAPPLALAGLVGLARQGWRVARGAAPSEALLVAWWLPYLALTGAFYAKFPRYMLPAVPCLCLAAAALLLGRAGAPHPAHRRAGWGLALAVLASSVLACLAYAHIYAAPNTRVAASDWIYRTVPPESGGHRTVITHEVWDDGLPIDRSAREPAWRTSRYAYVDLPMYDADDARKQQALIDALGRADYVVEASEIVRGSILRNPDRYPMTVAFYRALDDGRLGFREVAEFRSVPTLLGMAFDDRRSDLNWQFYDHPPVTVYRKVEDRSPSDLAALLPVPGAPLPAPAAHAPDHPSLALSPRAAALDAVSPSLGALFPPDGLGMRFPVPVWLLTIELVGVAALPWSIRLLRALPDAGYCGGKALGLLLLGWGVWLPTSVGAVAYRRSSILVVLGLLVAAGVVGWWTLPHPRRVAGRYWRIWLASEAVFLVAFGVFLWIRAFNPDLWQLYRGGEKPMELSYLHAILRSQAMPPYDPWLSGTTINYYYYGLFLIATLLKLTTIAPEVGFNLAIPLIYALAMQLAAGVGYALTAALPVARGHAGRSQGERGDGRAVPIDRRAALGALATVALFGVLGNLDTGPYVLGLLQQSGAQAWPGIGRAVDGALQIALGLGRALVSGGASLPGFNYFDRTRVIPFTINEFPFFSFLYADLHPHLIDLPFELLAAAFAVALALGHRTLANVPLRPSMLLLGGLVLGALWPTNPWDYPTCLLLVVAGAWVGCYDGRRPRSALLPVALFGAGLAIVGRLAYLPFYRHFYALDSGLGVPRHHSDIWHFVLVYGLFLVIAGTLLVVEQGLPAERLALWCLPGILLGLVAQAAVLALLIILLTLLLRAVLLRRHQPHILASLLPLGVSLAVILGTELVFVKDPLQGDDWQRMNTVFKFGVQAWLLLSLSCGPLAVWLLARAPSPFLRRSPAPTRGPRCWSDREALAPVTPGSGGVSLRTRCRLLPAWWRVLLGVLVGCAALYPLLATPAKERDRWERNAATPSLDGMAFMRANYPGDYAAITWLQREVPGIPVLLEANKGIYAWYGRVSWFTGLPTVLGWDYHTSQFHDPAEIPVRKEAIDTIYTTVDVDTALGLLHRYHVGLIYVGDLEREAYAAAPPPAAGGGSGGGFLNRHGAGLEKFPRMVGSSLDLVYDAYGVTIYRVRGEG